MQGSWQGTGKGAYPTITPFEYEEHLHFEVNLAYPLIHYEQKTVLLPDRQPSHWESGFIRVLENGAIEISNSQDSGRVEVLRGFLNLETLADRELLIEFNHVAIAHDPRVVQTRRIFSLRGDVLRYQKFMATHTTPQPKLQQHLEAVLRKL